MNIYDAWLDLGPGPPSKPLLKVLYALGVASYKELIVFWKLGDDLLSSMICTKKERE